MPRPPKHRFVEFEPAVTYFKPAGVPMHTLDEVRLGVDEFEALRLSDLEGLEQEAGARRMGLGQSTFQRIVSAARGKLTRALVEGKAIRIEGGPYRVVARTFICTECGMRWDREAPAEEDPRPPCPGCGGREVRPQWHRGRGRGPRGR